MASPRLSAHAYIQGVLAGDRGILSRAITLVESRLPSDQELAAEVLSKLQPHSGKSFRLGITGVPGVGKSTFTDAFGMMLVESGHMVAVLAIDPSSSITHGSILGDKTRMERLSRDPRAYIRPTAARGSLGGVARATREAMLLCEAAGFDFIIIETVGVGQSEIAVHTMVDFFLLLMLAGAGDELQGIKKGIMEMADGLVINKADGDNLMRAKQARAEYETALHLFPLPASGWMTPVLTCSAVSGDGLQEIQQMLERFQQEMQSGGFLEEKRKAQAKEWMLDTLRHLLETRFFEHPVVKQSIQGMEKSVETGEVPPTVAASQLIALYLQALAQTPG
jgi:LAO/AO transport system kinase